MIDNAIYPWQKPLWQQLTSTRDRLPHAMLLRGRSGIGKFDFAKSLTNALLCQTPDSEGFACGVCASCGWFAQGNHPDYRLLSPEQDATGDEDSPAPAKTSKRSQILIGQIRELDSFLEQSSHSSDGLRIVLIYPAEALNPIAANALLKMLEEPPKGLKFILVADQPHRLLATIMSRCNKIDMPIPSRDDAVTWLAQHDVKDAAVRLDYAGGSPISALEDAEEGAQSLATVWQMLTQGAKLDVFPLATLCASLGMENAIHAIQKWVYDIMACRFTGKIRYHTAHASALQALSERVDLGLLMDFQRKLNQARKTASHPLNNELQLENILLNYIQLFSMKTRP
ncbi:MAG TPA: DNA polymerase III subunit delta' [Methylophilaceae bacterium]|nr:DNA polymerase III subunit delta' [Methylophilaceae bacterium]